MVKKLKRNFGHRTSVVNTMLFLGYWELDENIAPKELAKIVTEALEKGLWPAEGINLIGYYTSVDVPTWGVMIFEAENPEQARDGYR